MTRFVWLLALVAGGASAMGFEPLNLWPVALAALVLLCAVLASAPNRRSAFFRGWLFALGQFSIGLNWIATAFVHQDAMPAWLGWVAVILLSAYLAVFPALAGLFAWGVGVKGKLRPAVLVVALAGGWIVAEWLRAWVFTGFPWSPLGSLLLPLDMAGAARFVGSYGLAGPILLIAGGLWLLTRRAWRSGAGLALASIAVLVIGGIDYAGDPTPDPQAPMIRIVQPNLTRADLVHRDYVEIAYTKLADETIDPAATRPRLVLWPEGAFPLYLESGYPSGYYYGGSGEQNRAILADLLNPGDVLLTGHTSLNIGSDDRVESAENSVLAVDSAGDLLSDYDKAHLVPFGEYLPAEGLLSQIGLRRLVPGDIFFAPGAGPANIDLPGFGAIGVQICYEIIFSGQVVDPDNRPDALFNASYDGWYGSWGPPQHLAQTRLRALEEGLPIMRSTTTGISAVVDADGDVLASVALDTAGHIDAPLPPAEPPTLFAQWGNALPIGFALILIIIAVALRRRQR